MLWRWRGLQRLGQRVVRPLQPDEAVVHVARLPPEGEAEHRASGAGVARHALRHVSSLGADRTALGDGHAARLVRTVAEQPQHRAAVRRPRGGAYLFGHSMA